ncbi:MAG: sugar-binding domain-containing protein [Armatimonadota bacterium]
MRERDHLGSNWLFFKGDAADADRYAFDDQEWQKVNVPHDFSIEGPFDKNNIMWAGYLPKGIAWYRKYIEFDNYQPGKKYFIEFEGVFRNSSVWVNGELLQTHRYGYTGFICDLTPYLYADKPNVLAVKVDNPDTFNESSDDREGWWYEGCGIFRNVWLISTGLLHVAKWGTFVTTPSISESEATVNIKTTLQNDAEHGQQYTLETDIADSEGNIITTLKNNGSIPSGGSEDIVQIAAIANPNLWSPDSPYLYNANTKVIVDGEISDTYRTPFGIRWYEFTSDKGFFLNGKHMQLRGMCIHHDFGGLGVALPDRANYKTVEVMKEMGCNLLRSSHNDASPSLMDACDQLGLLVWAETRYLDEAEVSLPPLRDLIHRNRNHPSIICWSLANTAGSADGKLTEYLKVMNDVAHEEDPTRLTAFGCEANTDANANGFAFVTSIMGYNGGGMGIDDRDHELYPERKMLISEFSSGRGARGIYEEIESNIDSTAILGDGRILALKGQYCSIYDLCTQFELEWSHIVKRPWLAGGAMWSGIEYWGETSGWPVVTSQFGVLDLCRFPKDTYYYFLQEWTDKPMVHIFPHWNWAGKEGSIIKVWCYSNCDSVELFLNGESLGSNPRNPLGHIEWEVPYNPGAIRAQGTVNGAVVCSHEIKTTGCAAKIELSADRTVLKADNRDLSFITVSITDKDGSFVPTACDKINVKVSGSGRLIGLGSGDPRSHENPKHSSMKAFNGLLLAVVQNNGQPGEIVVSVSSEQLESRLMVLSAASG